ncbi:MAG: serpin family protein [Candidatus Aenigmarchaeota archaeon]|nr:serpin family protein [Candidatus Aenigmarchaeota archaeon]
MTSGKNQLPIVFVVLLLISAIAVGSMNFLFPYSPFNPPKANSTGSSENGIKEVIESNNRFALELYSQLEKSEKGNIFYSPYSIYSALAMTYEGARGKTAEEMRDVFHFPDYEVLRPNFAAVYNDINEGGGDYTLRTGNALWIQKNYPILKDYLDTVEKYYGGKATNLDFASEPEKSRQTINRFIEEQTNHKIKDLIPPGFIDPATRLILTNAIYFKGTWRFEFNPEDTRPQEFKISPTETVEVPMMYMKPDKAKFNYADLGNLQILELPYKGDKISMIIILPKGDLSSIEPITLDKIESWESQMEETKLDAIYLPKFEFDTKYFMRNTLKSMGMPTAFSSSADFSGITGTKDLYIDEVIHQAYVKVDEEGTEAAAATAVVMKLTAVMPRKVFRADHPFLFLIQDRENGNILFLGRVVDPTE